MNRRSLQVPLEAADSNLNSKSNVGQFACQPLSTLPSGAALAQCISRHRGGASPRQRGRGRCWPDPAVHRGSAAARSTVQAAVWVHGSDTGTGRSCSASPAAVLIGGPNSTGMLGQSRLGTQQAPWPRYEAMGLRSLEGTELGDAGEANKVSAIGQLGMAPGADHPTMLGLVQPAMEEVVILGARHRPACSGENGCAAAAGILATAGFGRHRLGAEASAKLRHRAAGRPAWTEPAPRDASSWRMKDMLRAPCVPHHVGLRLMASCMSTRRPRPLGRPRVLSAVDQAARGHLAIVFVRRNRGAGPPRARGQWCAPPRTFRCHLRG